MPEHTDSRETAAAGGMAMPTLMPSGDARPRGLERSHDEDDTRTLGDLPAQRRPQIIDSVQAAIVQSRALIDRSYRLLADIQG